MISINPTTGAQKITDGPSANIIKLEGVNIPVSIFTAITLGEAPAFAKVASLTMENGNYVANTDRPRMKIVYGDTIESITLLEAGPDNDSIEITLGERTGGEGYVASAVISFDFGLGEAKIAWHKVLLHRTFPTGFFSFSEP